MPNTQTTQLFGLKLPDAPACPASAGPLHHAGATAPLACDPRALTALGVAAP